MADRLFDRAFNRAAAASEDAERPMQSQGESVQAEAGAANKIPATPMQVSDAVQRILQADHDKDYFRYKLQVCKPFFAVLLSSNAHVTVVGVTRQLHCSCFAIDLWSCHSLKQMSWGVQSWGSHMQTSPEPIGEYLCWSILIRILVKTLARLLKR